MFADRIQQGLTGRGYTPADDTGLEVEEVDHDSESLSDVFPLLVNRRFGSLVSLPGMLKNIPGSHPDISSSPESSVDLDESRSAGHPFKGPRDSTVVNRAVRVEADGPDLRRLTVFS